MRRVKTKLKKKLTRQETITQVNFTLHGIKNNLKGQAAKLESAMPTFASDIARLADDLDVILIKIKEKKNDSTNR